MAPRSKSARRVRLPICLALWAILSAQPAPPVRAASQPTEYDVKAAYLLNFTRFIEWPPNAFADPTAPFAICILGRDPFGSVLEEIVKGESAGGRRIVIQHPAQLPAPQTCQIVFVTAGEKDVARVVAGLGPGVLTVGEGAAFVHEGGIAAFVLENRRVRFDISQARAEQASLKISSRLLNVARLVEK